MHYCGVDEFLGGYILAFPSSQGPHAALRHSMQAFPAARICRRETGGEKKELYLACCCEVTGVKANPNRDTQGVSTEAA